MVAIHTVLLKVASRCNIDCRYCYIYKMGDAGWSRMPKRMSGHTCRAAARELARLADEQGHSFAVVLHGGEPLLAGATKLQQMLSILRNALPHETAISIQTNGLLITDEILDICSNAGTTISISLDGPRQIHDKNRISFRGHGTFDGVMEGIRRLQAHPHSHMLFSGLLAVVDPESDPSEVYHFFKHLSAPSVDFIYRDGNHSRLPPGKAAKSTTEYGDWMARMLNLYLADRSPIRIRILDDMIKLALGGVGTKDGVGLTDYGVLIVDTDGSLTKNDTLKSSFDGADRFDQHWSVHTHRIGDVVKSEEFAAYHAMQQPNHPTCLACEELAICGGGMTLHRWSDESKYHNPSVYCQDQKLLIGKIRDRLANVDTH